MPDHRKHRGAHPEDGRLFALERVPTLRATTYELSWLLTRDYPPKAALKLVGDHYALTERQRIAVARASCGDGSLARRRSTRVELPALRGEDLAVDGFNLIITLEAALSGAVLLRCRDGCTRDMASIHGSYRSVEETEPAIQIIGEALAALEPRTVLWLLDSPVSNSGRLAARLRQAAGEHGWPWTVNTVFNPDQDLIAGDRIVISSDSVVLDGAGRWADLIGHVIPVAVPDPWQIDLCVLHEE